MLPHRELYLKAFQPVWKRWKKSFYDRNVESQPATWHLSFLSEGRVTLFTLQGMEAIED